MPRTRCTASGVQAPSGHRCPGVELRCSQDGEVLARGPNVFDGYLAGEGPDAEGWFATGDLGEFDTDGYLRIVGRTKELIISGGQNVHPREVAETLERHRAITEAAVVGEPHPEWGEAVVAYVVGEPEKLDEVRAWLRGQLAAYKQPKQFRYVDALPRNAMGKIVPSDLAKTTTQDGGGVGLTATSRSLPSGNATERLWAVAASE